MALGAARIECPLDTGIFPHPFDCAKFIMCANRQLYEYTCPLNTVFNPNTIQCDWKSNVKCDLNSEIDNSIDTDAAESSPKQNAVVAPPTTSPVTTTTATSSQPISGSEKDNTNSWSPPIGSTTTAEPDPSEGFKDDYVLVCYFTNWAWYRPVGGKFIPEDINANYCTHINYGFAVLDSNTLKIKVHDSWADIDNRFFRRVVSLKEINPKLKVLLSLGGWNDSSDDKYSRLVNSPTARAAFIDHAVTFLNQYGFDGLDIDWEYPKCWQGGCERGPESDKPAFAQFVHELKERFGPKKLLLTAAVSPGKAIIDAGFDIPKLSQDFDFVNIMAYDYHGTWEKFASHHSPLYSRPESAAFDAKDAIFNANFTVNYWINKGMPSKKLVLGMPLYGRTFRLSGNPNKDANKGYGMTASGAGQAGQFTREAGMLSYYEICDLVKKQGWKQARDERSVARFAYSQNEWVGYDDTKSLAIKSEYIKKMNLLGGMIWALDFDDFTGNCCGTKYPLMKTLNAYLRGVESFKNITCV